MAMFRTYHIDGFQLSFTGRKTWKATLKGGGYDEVVPVTWTRDMTNCRGRAFVKIYYTNFDELVAKRTDAHPFIAAVAVAKDWNARPLKFKEFAGVFLCRSAFERTGEYSFKAEIIRQMHGEI